LSNEPGERLFHSAECAHLFIDIVKLGFGALPNVGAAGFGSSAKREQIVDLVERETEFLSTLDEPDSVNGFRGVGPIVGRRARRLLDQATPLVVAECFDVNARSLGDLSNGQFSHGRPLGIGSENSIDPVSRYGVKAVSEMGFPPAG
jgi:hypothetical protein